MILAGLWFGSSKPAMWVYLKPFHSALSRLERDGKVIESPYRPGILNICTILLRETWDLAANACICHNVHFNGSFCCFKCLRPDCTTKAGQKGELVHTFHFNRENLKGVQRTHAEFLADAKEAISEGKAVRGVKSPCWFAGLQYYDIVKGTADNYMHCVLVVGRWSIIIESWSKSSSDATIDYAFFIIDCRGKIKNLLVTNKSIKINKNVSLISWCELSFSWTSNF